jgi:hypothetical protein
VEELNEDPFAHFLSPVTDAELEEEILAFSAGIIAGPAPSRSTSSTSSLRDPSGAHAESAAAKGWRVRQALRGRWDRYVARYHPSMQDSFSPSSEERLVQAEAASHSLSKQRYYETRRRASVTGKPVYDSDDEGYESSWSSSSEDHAGNDGTRHVRLQLPSSSRKHYSSPPGTPPQDAVTPTIVIDEPDVEYYILSTGKRVKIEARTPSSLRASTSASGSSSLSLLNHDLLTPPLSPYGGDVTPILESDSEDMEMELDMPRSPSPEPVPSLGHAAYIAARNEKMRRRMKSTGKSRRRQLQGPMGGAASRARYAKEPGWNLFTVVEEGEE